MHETALADIHPRLGAKMVEFAGWRMPVQYGPILDEVRAVREAAGLFDLGHMGRVEVSGPDAARFLDRVTTNWCARIPENGIRYALMLREDGYPLDDLLVYRDGPERFFLVINAANHDRDLEWLRRHAADFDVRIEDRTFGTGMVALQGPRSAAILQPLTDLDLASLRYYTQGFGTVCGVPDTRVSRTGYTGEDGFEVYFDDANAERIWNALLEAGREHGLRPIGLGARDTLRLEAGMALYGHEIDERHHPLEAGLGFAVRFDEGKGDWIGRDALRALGERPTRRLVGITTEGPRVPRQGYELLAGDEVVGEVCSGAVSPTLGTNIGSAYVRLGHDAPDTELELSIRGKRQPCRVRELPFYSRTRKKKDS